MQVIRTIMRYEIENVNSHNAVATRIVGASSTLKLGIVTPLGETNESGRINLNRDRIV